MDYHDHGGDWEKKVNSSEVTTPRKDGANEMTTNCCERDGVYSNSVLYHEQCQLVCVDGGGLVKVKTVETAKPNAHCPVAISLSNLSH